MVLQRKMVRKDQQDPASPFCTKQMKDITVRCNRLYSNLHTQVSHANVTSIAKSPMSPKILTWQKTWMSHVASTHALQGVNNIISKQKRLDNTARPKLLRTPCCEDIFFTATNGSSRILKDMYKQKHIKQKHILPSRNLSEGHANSVAFTACDIQQVPGSNASDMQRKRSTKTWTKHRTTLTLWQQRKWSTKNLSAWFARCPWAPASWASAWQSTCCQFAIMQQQNILTARWPTVSQPLNNNVSVLCGRAPTC